MLNASSYKKRLNGENVPAGFHDPNWGPEACERYVRFPEILKIFTATAVGSRFAALASMICCMLKPYIRSPVVFILRLYAIWGRNRNILICFSVLLALEIAVKIVSLIVYLLIWKVT